MHDGRAPKVAIVCLAYNHQEYIADALRGFVAQSAYFDYEVIVHDDCSSDLTPEIINDFAVRYPDIIKPIYESENQYSKGVALTRRIIEESKADYIALCEGDDYWIDPMKLRKQYDYMKAHTECTFCFGNAYRVNASDGSVEGLMLDTKHPVEGDVLMRASEGMIGVNDIALLGFLPTASFFFTREAYCAMPTMPKGAFSGDRAMQLFLTHAGGAHFINEPMAVYRVGVPGSATARNFAHDKKIATLKSYIRLNEFFNAYTNYAYKDAINLEIGRYQYEMMIELRNPRMMPFSELLAVTKSYGGKTGLLKALMFRAAPNLYVDLRSRKSG